MINRNNFNLGDEIKNIVQDAVNNRDFNRLSNDIGRLVNGALDEVKQSIKKSRDVNRSQSFDSRYSYNDRREWHKAPTQVKPYKKPKQPAYTVPVGRVSGALCTVFGLIGSIGTLIAISVMGILSTVLLNSGVFLAIGTGLVPCLLLSMLLYMKGKSIRKRLQRFNRYISQLNGRSYCLIKDFSSVTGLNQKNTVKDLQKMIACGMFPQGHLDDKKTCFMLNNESYEQYLQLQENMRMKAEQEQSKVNEQAASQSDNTKAKADIKPEIRRALNEGRLYVQEIKNANVAIPGEDVSNKLDRLELVTGRIFDYVETHPEKYPEIKKFTEYFLPTTLKLVNAYKELDLQPVEGLNISNTKKEIENTLDTINLAFERLLDGLFEDTAMDVSTDITVLETMLAQEGLTENNLGK